MGPLQVWLQRLEGEWRYATQEDEEDDHNPSQRKEVLSACSQSPLESLTVSRWIPPDLAKKGALAQEEVILKPAMPDRPIVVRTENHIRFAPGASGLFFVSMPLRLRVLLSKRSKDDFEMLSVSTQRLSNTWFGNSDEGELCYALKSRAKYKIDELKTSSYRAVCAVHIKNLSTEKSLEFDRICIDTRYMGLVEGKNKIWTSTISYRWHGTREPEEVHYRMKAQDYDEILGELADPLESPHGGVIKKSLSSLRSLVGLGR